ncbi:MAG TPA: hypothetical protein IAB89_09565 [Candidatus Caccousia avicola]|uniref:Uncharacterized protein n=1 Tax=Candidatus Caccousia avicola TaxID=2840721 RepID=A0A9D1APD2_9FIRM|nr:hypothetical protein [Candidatus Caccousia avicola]
MKASEAPAYTKTIRLRIWGCWTAIVLMTAYMIVLVELGGGDSRMMTRTADFVTDLLYFGGIIFLGVRIHANKKLLKNRLLLREQQEAERDERTHFLHDKSGGFPMDALLLVTAIVVFGTGLFNMAAFYTSFGLLCAAIVLKAGSYLYYDRKY